MPSAKGSIGTRLTSSSSTHIEDIATTAHEQEQRIGTTDASERGTVIAQIVDFLLVHLDNHIAPSEAAHRLGCPSTFVTTNPFDSLTRRLRAISGVRSCTVRPRLSSSVPPLDRRALFVFELSHFDLHDLLLPCAGSSQEHPRSGGVLATTRGRSFISSIFAVELDNNVAALDAPPFSPVYQPSHRPPRRPARARGRTI